MSDPRIGVDVGGTFTDFVLYDPEAGTYRTLKVFSTPEDPSEGVRRGLDRAEADSPEEVVHGSTVATNAVLERKGARTALVTTGGFEDVLTIARQNRTDLYDLSAGRPAPLVPPDRCFGVDERVDGEGRVLRELDEEELDPLVDALRAADVESVAVSLLFSFLHPEHEERVAERLRDEGFDVSRSSEILPEFREYERASTTAVNAYVGPILDRYLGRLDRSLGDSRFRIMQSNGGSVGTGEARRHGVRSILSGPAGGAVGALRVARGAGHENVISFDMGGTSTDVSLLRGGVEVTSEARVGGLPVRVPVIDIHTVGAGGGSVGRVDAGGALRVGPESAGADPGPACYGRGGERATVTDAHVVLGRLPPDAFLGGRIALDADRAERALDAVGREAGLEPGDGLSRAERAALGVVRVANAHMERALRVISVERGHEPEDFAMVSYGGAGGLHAAELARRLGIAEVVVPPAASVLSAFGMLSADVVRDYVRTVMLPGDTRVEELRERIRPMAERGRRDVGAEGVPTDRIHVEPALDMRYRGQSYELEVPLEEEFVSRFHREHRRAYGHAEPGAPVEVVNLRVRAVGEVRPPPLPDREPGPADPEEALRSTRPVVLGADGAVGRSEVPVYDGEALRPGHEVPGPAVVARSDTTVLLGPGDRARVDRRSNMRVSVGGEER
mgnify:CR=1 FL=1